MLSTGLSKAGFWITDSPEKCLWPHPQQFVTRGFLSPPENSALRRGGARGGGFLGLVRGARASLAAAAPLVREQPQLPSCQGLVARQAGEGAASRGREIGREVGRQLRAARLPGARNVGRRQLRPARATAYTLWKAARVLRWVCKGVRTGGGPEAWPQVAAGAARMAAAPTAEVAGLQPARDDGAKAQSGHQQPGAAATGPCSPPPPCWGKWPRLVFPWQLAPQGQA
jgi:hypothetical protein